jgi:hypothetical protein
MSEETRKEEPKELLCPKAGTATSSPSLIEAPGLLILST